MNSKFWKDKRVLITGHSGFKGSWLSMILNSMGAEILGISSESLNNNSELFKVLNIVNLVESYDQDIRDPDKIMKIVSNFKPEIVFHLAAQPLVRESYRLPVDTYEINIMGTINILEAIRANDSVSEVMQACHSEHNYKVSNVVMMGMGEPLANFENVVSALDLMLDDNAYGLSRRRVTVSTSGLVPAMDRLSERCPVALAVSLHAPNDMLRDELVPINKKYPLKELLAACRRYLKTAPRNFITFEYIMLAGINDNVSQARELVKLVKDTPCKFNLIPFNPFPNSGYKCSSSEAIRQFRDVLMQAGLISTVRKTRGDDIDAACGQLAGKVLDRTRRKSNVIMEVAG